MTRDPYPFATANEPVATLRDVVRWTLAGFAICVVCLALNLAFMQSAAETQELVEVRR